MKNVLALLADWANGLLALLAAGYLTDTEILLWYIPIALLLSHLPDIDAIPELLRYGRVGADKDHVRDHRTFLHYPLLAVLLCLGAVMYGGFWGVVVAIVIPLHLLNDLYGTGWGLPLLWPLSNDRFKLLGRRANRLRVILEADGDWELLSIDDRRFRLLVRWRAEELPGYISRFGVDRWIERWYFRPNWVSGVEYSLFVVACILTIVYFLV